MTSLRRCFLERSAVLVLHTDDSHRAVLDNVSKSPMCHPRDARCDGFGCCRLVVCEICICSMLREDLNYSKCPWAVHLPLSGEFSSTPCSNSTRRTSADQAPTGNCTSACRIHDSKSSLNGIVVSHVRGDISKVPPGPVRIDCLSLGCLLYNGVKVRPEDKVG